MNNLSNFPQGKTQKEGVHQERTILHKNPGREGRGSKSMAVKPTDDSADQKRYSKQKKEGNNQRKNRLANKHRIGNLRRIHTIILKYRSLYRTNNGEHLHYIVLQEKIYPHL